MKIDRMRRKETLWGGLHPNNLSKGIISLPIAQIKIAKYLTFLPISHQIRFCTTNTFWKVPRQINAYVSEAAHLKLRWNKSRMVEFWHRKFFRHYNEVFVEISMSCAIFPSFGQLDFPSFSGHFE
ncbi:hypothetical protein T08_2153 [Trichinella sp. T8]|nr:hypothetical protein T08_2153 [Trichinella sp. T8]